jgi:hypothetical protein
MRRLAWTRDRWTLLGLLLALATPACGGSEKNDGDPMGDGDGDGDGDGKPDAGGDSGSESLEPLLPWAEGNHWTYQVTDNGVTSTKEVTIGPEEPVGGSGPNKDKLAHKVTTSKGTNDETISWQSQVGDLVVRYREQSFGAMTGALQLEEHWAPYKLHVDGTAAHRVAGAEWLEQYDETKSPAGDTPVTKEARDHWLVDGVDQEVTVPAGTFRAIVLRKAGGTSTKTYWYVPGVGKVKETGGQTEVLVDFKVAP